MLIVAVYFGSWPWLENRARSEVASIAEATIRADIRAIRPQQADGGFAYDVAVFAPYVVTAAKSENGWPRHYYLWLFGWTVRLTVTTTPSNNGAAYPVDLPEFDNSLPKGDLWEELS